MMLKKILFTLSVVLLMGAVVYAQQFRGGIYTAVTSVVSPIFSSSGADPADAGVIRLANSDQILWESSPAGTDFGFQLFTDEIMYLGTSLNVTGNIITGTGFIRGFFQTDTNCADSAGAAACGSATGGSVVIDAAATTVVVSTTSVSANSQIFAQFDSSLGTRLGITCNATVAIPAITARTAGTSFTITVPAAPAVNPACFNYFIIN